MLGKRHVAVAYAEAVVGRFDAASLVVVTAPCHDFLWTDHMLHRGIILLDDEKVGRLIIDYDGSDDVHRGGYSSHLGAAYYDHYRKEGGPEDSDGDEWVAGAGFHNCHLEQVEGAPQKLAGGEASK